ncbi:hypothetical protein [Marininema halotolerans]|uniref:hypothetical protein n=1 Tax=Marininema halotolerans TaxID=1155944 RepID=UPI001124F21E|nr:hypothetical protein [Marininema halotolerans]
MSRARQGRLTPSFRFSSSRVLGGNVASDLTLVEVGVQGPIQPQTGSVLTPSFVKLFNRLVGNQLNCKTLIIRGAPIPSGTSGQPIQRLPFQPSLELLAPYIFNRLQGPFKLQGLTLQFVMLEAMELRSTFRRGQVSPLTRR